VAEAEQSARRGQPERRLRHGEEHAGRDLNRAADDEQARPAAPVGEPPERDREEERHERKRSSD